MSTQQALTTDCPGKMGLKEVPILKKAMDEVLIKAEFCGICGSDIESPDGTRPAPC